TNQYLRLLSATYPAIERSTYPSNSPPPAMIPTTKALAPSDSRNGPVMLRAPSYVISANKLTMPMIRTNLNASFATGELFFAIYRSCVKVYGGADLPRAMRLIHTRCSATLNAASIRNEGCHYFRRFTIYIK